TVRPVTSGEGPTASTSPVPVSLVTRAASRAKAAASSDRLLARLASSIACCIRSSLISLPLSGRCERGVNHGPVAGHQGPLHDLVFPVDLERLGLLVEKQ